MGQNSKNWKGQLASYFRPYVNVLSRFADTISCQTIPFRGHFFLSPPADTIHDSISNSNIESFRSVLRKELKKTRWLRRFAILFFVVLVVLILAIKLRY